MSLEEEILEREFVVVEKKRQLNWLVPIVQLQPEILGEIFLAYRDSFSSDIKPFYDS